MTDNLPPLPGHPEHGWVWTEAKQSAIRAYAAQCVAAERGRIPRAPRVGRLDQERRHGGADVNDDQANTTSGAAVAAPVYQPVRPLLWMVRHRDDSDDSTGAMYRTWRDAVQHAALFQHDFVSIVAIGDIDAAVATERERWRQWLRLRADAVEAASPLAAKALRYAADDFES